MSILLLARVCCVPQPIFRLSLSVPRKLQSAVVYAWDSPPKCNRKSDFTPWPRLLIPKTWQCRSGVPPSAQVKHEELPTRHKLWVLFCSLQALQDECQHYSNHRRQNRGEDKDDCTAGRRLPFGWHCPVQRLDYHCVLAFIDPRRFILARDQGEQ